MTLQTNNFATLVSNMTAAVQGAALTVLDLTVGSVIRAILEATAAVALWLQFLVLQVLQITRLATSTGNDVDTFVGDFGLTRLAGVASTCQVTFTSLAPTNQSSTISVGAIVRTADATQTFAVVEVDSNPNWNAGIAAYIRPAGTASIIIPCQNTTAGTAGNVQSNTLTLLGTQISGIDTVNNANSATGGLNAESDGALKTRFAAYINSRSGATPLAVAAAIQGVQQGLDYEILEGQATNGASRPGWFGVLIDDGSGNPSQTLLQLVYAAIDVIRPIGISFAVAAPGVVPVDVVAAITVAPTASNAAAQNAAVTAITTYLTGLAIGVTTGFAQLSAVIVQASGTISGVSSLTINGGTSNIVPTSIQVCRPRTITVMASGGTSP